MTKTVLIIGGYGVFGGYLARALARDKRLDVIVAGRDLAKAKAFCKLHGGRGETIDTQSDDINLRIAKLSPFIVVDAAGPFQMYQDDPYHIAKAAIACNAHYLDLSDDADFTKGISNLNKDAQAAGVTVLSGVSSVPALSSAAVVRLSKGMSDIHLIESVILPGNRAPRGLSVMRAILGQVGKPLQFWSAGRTESTHGWSNGRSETLEVTGVTPIHKRRSSLIGAPDLALFPEYFNARSVEFRAGLELGIMHWGLTAISWLVRLRLLRSAEPFTNILKRIADFLEPYGSDRGGMRVRIVGTLSDGSAVTRQWSLIAEAGDGPQIPSIAARVMCGLLLEKKPKIGARPCLGEFTLQQAENEMRDLQSASEILDHPYQTIFQTVLKERYHQLPPIIQDLHQVLHMRRWQGKAELVQGEGLLVKLICGLVGFPPTGQNVPVTVTMHRRGTAEYWQRDFAGKRFKSVLTAADEGAVWERFGPFSFEIAFTIEDGVLGYPVRRARLFGVPWPKALTPTSNTIEAVDEQGNATFDVAVSLPFIGKLIHYKGWLQPENINQ